MKNENGTGSVYKLKGKRRKPWVVRITTGYSIDGKQLRKCVGTYETKREAQKALLNYCENPLLFSGKTFGEIKEAWYRTHTKKVSGARLKGIDSLLKNLEIFNNLKINRINLIMLQDFFDNLNCASGTKHNLKSLLNLIFNYALKNDLIENNKVSFIDLGKKESVVQRKIFTQKEIDILFQNVNSTEKYINICYIVIILIYTGLRISELLNLKNDDIDFISNTITIRKSKTSAGVRTIPIPDKIIPLFKNNYKQNQTYFIKGNKKEKEIYITFEYRFKKMLELLNLDSHTIHDTRHTFATLLNNANANSTSIIKLIGHSDFATTQNVYTHKDIEELRKAVNLLN